MQNLSVSIQEIAKKILDENKATVIVGFEKGTLPLRSTPCFIRSSSEVNKLVWNGSCENNLANFLRKKKEPIAVVAKGCDTRAILGLIKENQIDRDNLVIIGVPCNGMLDRKKIDHILEGQELISAEELADEVILKTNNTEIKVPRNELLHASCKECHYPNPEIYDYLVGEKVAAKSDDDYADIIEFEKKPAEERLDYFLNEMSKCIRCYACRNACPMCYCEECFVDSSSPQWISKSIDPKDNLIFQIVRAFHQAGRCVDCGACERACPMGLNIRKLTRKLIKDSKDLFGYEAGLNNDEPCLLTAFKMDDPEPFLVKE